MNNKLTKTLTVFAALLLVSAVGYGTVYGYGSSASRGGSRKAPVVTTAPDNSPSLLDVLGEVLGASTYSFENNLGYGMQGPEVVELQERLRAEGFFTFHTSTGYFGPITLEAVKAYQAANGIPNTGFVGPLTRAALNK